MEVPITLSLVSWLEIEEAIDGIEAAIGEQLDAAKWSEVMGCDQLTISIKHGAVRVLIGQLDNAGLCELARKIEGQVDR